MHSACSPAIAAAPLVRSACAPESWPLRTHIVISELTGQKTSLPISRGWILCVLLLLVGQFTVSARSKIELRHIITDTATGQRVAHRSRVRDTAEARSEATAAVQWLQKRSYLLASADSLVCQSDTCRMYIHLGPQFSRAGIRPDPALSDALAQAGLPQHRPFTARQYLSLRPQILRYYEDSGYPFAQLVLDCIELSDGQIRARLRCDAGEHWKIGTIIFSDTAGAHPTFLCNQINLKPGDPFSQKYIDEIEDRLSQLPFVEPAGAPAVTFDVPGLAAVAVPSRKLRANSFDGILGFAPNSAENEKLIVTGSVKLELHNALRQGEELKLEWEKLDEFSQNAQAEAGAKYLFGTRLGCNAGLWIKKQDTSLLNTRLLGQISYYFKGSSSAGANYKQVQSKLITAAAYDSVAQRIKMLESKIQLGGLSYRVARADRRINPRRGHILQLDASTGTKRYRQTKGVPDSVFAPYSRASEVMELGYLAELYIPLSKPLVLMLGSSGQWLYAPQLFSNELYRIGGAKSLRGFNEQSIYASAYTIGTAELRLLFDRMSNIYVFYNQAYYRSHTVNADTHDQPLGFGLGLSVASRNSTFTISYAVGRQYGNPILFSAGKIHFGLINRF